MELITGFLRRILPRSFWGQKYLVDRVNVRVPVYFMNNISIDLTEPVAGNFKLANISSGGFALSTSDSIAHEFRVDETVKGTIQFATKAFPFSGRVRHYFGHLVGVQFVDVQPDLVDQFHKYFQSEIEGQLLKRVDKPIKSSQGEEIVLFESESAEVKLTLKNDSLTHFQIYFLGHFIDGGPNRPTRYGVLAEKKGESKEASLTDEVPKEVSSMVRKFVFSINNFPGQWAEQIDFCLWLH